MQDKKWSIIEVDVDQLKPFERNPRTITETQFDKLVQSLVMHGQFKTMTATKDLRIIGGHQRIKAMKKLGWVKCHVSVPEYDLDDEEFKTIALRDNHNNGVWDMDILSSDYELEFMRAIGLHDVMNIPPMDDGEPDENAGRKMVCCPKCQNQFPVKGNKVKENL